MVLNYTKPYQLSEALIILPPETVYAVPKTINFREGVDTKNIHVELNLYVKKLMDLGVQVHKLQCDNTALPNIMFASDNTLAYNGDLYLPAMDGDRFYEQQWLYDQFPEAKRLPKAVSFESSDLLVTNDALFLGVGNRTSLDITKSLLQIFGAYNINFIQIPEGIQHLMGLVRPISRHRVAVRAGQMLYKDVVLFERWFGEVIRIPETKEITEGLAFNFVPIRENEIIMPDDTPELKSVFEKQGVLVHTSPIKYLRKGDGGLACATGRLA